MSTYRAMPYLKLAQDATLAELKQIKYLSDHKRYASKHDRIMTLLQSSPDDWQVDSDNGRELGLTHAPTGFRFHIPKRVAQSTVDSLKPN